MAARISNWKKKAEQFLKSYLKENGTNSEEAAVYFLSRGKKDKAILNAINAATKGWRNDDTRWEDKTLHNATRAASILRLAQWAKIGALRQYRDNICQNLNLPSNHDFLTCFDSTCSAFFPLVFPLFTSDTAIREMSSRLIGQLHQWQDFLRQILTNKNAYDQSFNQPLSTLVAAFVFGVYRLQCGSIDKEVLYRSVQYLLDAQADSGLWGYDDTEQHGAGPCLGEHIEAEEQSENVVLVAMGIHALFVAKPSGAKTCIENAAQWLLGHQGSNGGWYHLGSPKYGHQVHATVLALDALELSSHQGTSHPQVTFTYDPNTKYPTDVKNGFEAIGKVQINDKLHTIVYEGDQIKIGGVDDWDLLTKLIRANGETVTHENLKALTQRADINVKVGELKAQLRSCGGAALADAIKNQRLVGYYIDLK
jgi:hypothetical protein